MLKPKSRRVVDDEEDCLVGSVEGVYMPKPGLCVINCDGVSAEDRKILDGRDEDFDEEHCNDCGELSEDCECDDNDDEDEEDDGE